MASNACHYDDFRMPAKATKVCFRERYPVVVGGVIYRMQSAFSFLVSFFLSFLSFLSACPRDREQRVATKTMISGGCQAHLRPKTAADSFLLTMSARFDLCGLLSFLVSFHSLDRIPVYGFHGVMSSQKRVMARWARLFVDEKPIGFSFHR